MLSLGRCRYRYWYCTSERPLEYLPTYMLAYKCVFLAEGWVPGRERGVGEVALWGWGLVRGRWG